MIHLGRIARSGFGRPIAAAAALTLASLTGCGPRPRTLTRQATSVERVERFLPVNTLAYGGVDHLGPALNELVELAQDHVHLPGAAGLEQMLLTEVSGKLGLKGVESIDDALTRIGLDPQGAAGVAIVPENPYEPFDDGPLDRMLLILPVKDAARVEEHLARLIHDDEADPLTAAQLRQKLGVREFGDVTLVGDRDEDRHKGYAIASSHLLLGGDLAILESAVDGSTRARPAPPQPPHDARVALRAFVQSSFFCLEARKDFLRDLSHEDDYRKQQFLRRLIDYLDAPQGVTADIGLSRDPDGKPRIVASLTWATRPSDTTDEWLQTPAGEITAVTLVPDVAPVAFGTNLGRQMLRLQLDAARGMGIDDRGKVTAVRKAMAAIDGDLAIAVTEGTIGNSSQPNMLFIARVADHSAKWAAVEALVATAGGPGSPAKRTEENGVTTVHVDPPVHYADAGPFFLVGSRRADVLAARAIQAGAAHNALVRAPRFAALLANARQANAVLLADLPALARNFIRADVEGQVRQGNRQCRHNLERIKRQAQRVKKATGKFPASLEEVRKAFRSSSPNSVWLFRPTWCGYSGPGPQPRLVYDPKTGEASCPTHGSLADFKPMKPSDAPRSVPEQFLSAFGAGAAHLWFDRPQVKCAVRLVPLRRD